MTRIGHFFRSGAASVIVGGQFGSEAKGLAAGVAEGWLSPTVHLICTTNAGAQAGHTTVLEDGRKFVCYHLPTIGVLRPEATIFLNAGSIIDPELLDREIDSVAEVMGYSPEQLRGRIVIHPHAAIILPRHKEEEATATRGVGSTMKGVGAALSGKIMRRVDAVAEFSLPPHLHNNIGAMDLMEAMDNGACVTVEIPQGTGLSIGSSGFFPKTTSRECWLNQGLTDAAIHSDYLNATMMVSRTFPIRVGNISDSEGQIVGHSGPFEEDSIEISWSQLPGIEPERTTVTKRVRRIASWSDIQYRKSLRLNRPRVSMLTFINYLKGEASLRGLVDQMKLAEKSILGRECIHVYSWGPGIHECTNDLDEAVRMMHQGAIKRTDAQTSDF